MAQMTVKAPNELSIAAAQAGGFVVRESFTQNQHWANGPGILFAGSLSECLEYMAAAFAPPMVVKPIPDEDMAAILKAGPGTLVLAGGGGHATTRDFLRSKQDRADEISGIMASQRSDADPLDLEDVLDVYRIEGIQAGVQVLGRERVIVWIGDIQRALTESFSLTWRANVAERPVVFHECDGFNAVAEAAKWLLERREEDRASNLKELNQ